ncbi:MAG: stage V sporulation protein AB [Lachnospiraceae bacterium]|nr:stage V sporulation protein AB [Lachnospiraceae bacterium]
MLLRRFYLGVLGSSFGLMTAGGVFTVLLAVGLIPRFAGKTHTGRKVTLYETMVILGTLAGNIMSVFDAYCMPAAPALLKIGIPKEILFLIGELLLVCFGLFAGIFVGSLAMAIAEMLDSIPIFARRVGFRHGLGIAVSAMALGKMAGSFYYFYEKIYLFGGV